MCCVTQARIEPNMKKTTWIAAAALIALIALVVYSSFQVGGYRCEVCMQFRGAYDCRTVDGASEMEALRAAITNACALLASGVTDSLACERTPPTTTHCTAF